MKMITLYQQFSHRLLLCILILASVTFLGIAVSLTVPSIATAQYGFDNGNEVEQLSGHAWSSTIGWISLNCQTGGADGEDVCAQSDYGVTVDSDGNLNGYAWSEHLGWLQFGGLSDFPNETSSMGNAQLLSDGTVYGWARFLSGHVYDDGWDGWVALNCEGTGSCSTSEHWLRFDTDTGNALSDSFAWGRHVVGWIDFSTVSFGAPSIASASISVDVCEIPLGESVCTVNVEWSSNNAVSPISVQHQGVPFSSAESGDEDLSLGHGLHTFTIAHHGGISLASREVDITCAEGDWDGSTCVDSSVVALDSPTVSVWAELSGSGSQQYENFVNITPDNTVVIVWDVTDIDPNADTTTCEARNALGSGPVDSSGGNQIISIEDFTFGESLTFGVRCRSTSGSDTSDWGEDSVQIHILQPTVTLEHNPGFVRSGDVTQVTWSIAIDESSGIFSAPTVSEESDPIDDYELSCNIRGAATENFIIPADRAYEDSISSGPLFNAFETRIQCEVLTGGVQGNLLEATHRVEVVPALQEN